MTTTSDTLFGSKNQRKSETVTRTLRLDSDIEKGLVELAERQNTSVNVIANRALRYHIEWGAQAKKFGYMSFSGTMMVRLMNLLDDEEVREIGEWTAMNLAMETAQYWFKRVDFDTALATLERLGTYGNRFRFDHSNNGRSHTIVLKHDMGLKWSRYFETAIKGWFKTILADEMKDFQAESTDNQVSIFVELKQ